MPENRIQVCRHPDPWYSHPIIVVSGQEVALNPKKMVAEGQLSKRKSTKLTIGTPVDIAGVQYDIKKVYLEPCPKLDRETGHCSLTDPTKCSGCVVLDRYIDLDEVQKLGRSKVDPNKKREIGTFLENATASLLEPDGASSEILEMAREFTERYSPRNKLTWAKIMKDYPAEYNADLIEEDPDTHVIFLCQNTETGIQRIKNLGVLKVDMGDVHMLRADLLSMSSLLPSLSEYSALTGRCVHESETLLKTFKAGARVEAEALIKKGILPLRCTQDTVDSVVRSSPEYAKLKDLEGQAHALSRTVWNKTKYLNELIQAIKHEIKSLEMERNSGGYNVQ